MEQKAVDQSYNYAGTYQWSAGSPPETSGPVVDSGAMVLDALNALDEQAAALAREGYMTQSGALKLLEAHRARVIDEATRQRSMLGLRTAELAAAEKKLFDPPKLEPTDVVGSQEDARRQVWFEKELNSEQRTAFASQMLEGQGQHREIAASLARSPHPGAAQTAGRQAWRALVEGEKAGSASTLAARKRSLRWLESILTLAPKIAGSEPWNDKPHESPLEKMNRARRPIRWLSRIRRMREARSNREDSATHRFANE
jgi:hypothetical protein